VFGLHSRIGLRIELRRELVLCCKTVSVTPQVGPDAIGLQSGHSVFSGPNGSSFLDPDPDPDPEP
jgi:hypothetical protein